MNPVDDFPKGNITMRDIFDFCVKHNLHNLAQGMIELPPPQKLRERTAKHCLEQDDIHQYRNRLGEEVYRNAIATLLRNHYKVKDATKDNVLAISGVSGGIFSTMLTLKNEKTNGPVRVGLLYPFYTYHLKQIQEGIGADPVFIATNDDFTPNWTELEDKLKTGLDLVMFTNPGNPQGNVWSKEDILKVVELTKKYNTMLLVDEIYSDLVWTGDYFSPLNDKIHSHVIVCRGFSKTLATQSWRVGYLVSSPETVRKIMAHADPVYISVSWTQHSLAEYLDKDYSDYVDHIKRTSDLMQYNWKQLSTAFQSALGWIPLNPSGSMYGLFRHSSPTDRDAILEGLRKGVGAAPGNIFYPGVPDNTGYVRIHVGISKDKCDEIVRLLNKSS